MNIFFNVTCIRGIAVVVQFYPWFKFSFLLSLGMVMYDNYMIMSLKQKKRKFEPRIKLNFNIATCTPISPAKEWKNKSKIDGSASYPV